MPRDEILVLINLGQLARVWVPGMGPGYGSRVWVPDMGPGYGSRVWALVSYPMFRGEGCVCCLSLSLSMANIVRIMN